MLDMSCLCNVLVVRQELHNLNDFSMLWPISLNILLTLSSPLMSNGYTSKCSGSYWSWSNPL